MLNLNLKHGVVVIERHEWVVGTESEPADAKTFGFAMSSIHGEMAELGVDLSYDDAYHVRAGDGGEVVFYVDIKRDPVSVERAREMGLAHSKKKHDD